MANKTKLIAFRVDKFFDKKIKDAARREDLTESEFERRLLDWGMEAYAMVARVVGKRGSALRTLLRISVPAEKQRKRKETK